MSQSTIISIADAVTATINGAALSQNFTAKRYYVPIHELVDLQDLKVSVVPSMLESELLTRSSLNQMNYSIDIAIQQSLGSGPRTEMEIEAFCDPLMYLAEQIIGLFTGKALAGFPQAICIEFANLPIFAPAHLDDLRVFTSVIVLKFRLIR